MVRKYSGPLQPGRRSAYVRGRRKNKTSKDKQQDKRIAKTKKFCRDWTSDKNTINLNKNNKLLTARTD